MSLMPYIKRGQGFELKIGDTIEIPGYNLKRLIYLGTRGSGRDADVIFRSMSEEGQILVCSKHHAMKLSNSVLNLSYETHCLSSGETGHFRRIQLDPEKDYSNMIQPYSPCALRGDSNLLPAHVHRQVGGTCYAHACATVLHAAESRIVGRKLESPEELAAKIISIHGSNGGNPFEVLQDLCKKGDFVSLSSFQTLT